MNEYRKVIARSLLLAGIIASLAGVVVFVLLLYLKHHEQVKEHTVLVDLWRNYLYAYYFAVGNWNNIQDQFEAGMIGADAVHIVSFNLIDITGHQIFNYDLPSVDQTFKALHEPILVQGKIVGYFDLAWTSQSVYGAALWVSLLVICIVFLLAFSLLYRYAKRSWIQQQQLTYVLGKLQEPETEFDPTSIHTIHNEVLRSRLTEVGNHIHKLETVRRRMVADISHELRTPISVMRLVIEGALETNTAISIEQACSILEELYRMSKLVQDLQQLSLSETGNLALRKSWISIDSLIEATVDSLLPGVEDTQTMTFHNLSKNVSVYVDPDRVQQVLINLLGNAIRHSRGIIEVRHSQEGANFVVEIEDNGVGIEEEELPYIFERFYRSSNTDRHSGFRGMGLGLAITRGIVYAHKGTISVESQWNVGTIFRITIPVFKE
ncbi:integral membrane sensor signal transduction histidine kinase [Paenibacillus curdlanolyticus YK9]|uniref:histidine kinase n=1 Tax=Paenibacillus curdlanolyticus YK9 TaxID=717606 RepID=E0I918_9BACL|nr:HAMP domain-containing sensor histidine kinase [Paenibacillus curdlanolyticus]EFM10902.1 integral membrane sensor signal transduction histidine kinase [Paenibacillus curdlanolyticus YK9]